jgi:hypothetical protein
MEPKQQLIKLKETIGHCLHWLKKFKDKPEHVLDVEINKRLMSAALKAMHQLRVKYPELKIRTRTRQMRLKI